MNISNTQQVTQSDFDVLPLFLSKQADNEIEINDNDVEGIVYICIDSEDDWIGFSFKASVTKVFTKGELWKDNYGAHCVDMPSVEIDNVTNITVTYNDGNVSNIDYTSRIDEINKLISDFIYTQELTVESKHNAYNTYLI